jgi:hypothetical protein
VEFARDVVQIDAHASLAEDQFAGDYVDLFASWQDIIFGITQVPKMRDN